MIIRQIKNQLREAVDCDDYVSLWVYTTIHREGLISEIWQQM